MVNIQFSIAGVYECDKNGRKSEIDKIDKIYVCTYILVYIEK